MFSPLQIKCCSMAFHQKLHCLATCCDLQAAEDTSAQLQQQLARMGTDLSSAEQELARLGQELSQAQQAKLEAIKVKLVVCLHNGNILHMATPFHYSIEWRRLLHDAAS